jgi:hypothetical protein
MLLLYECTAKYVSNLSGSERKPVFITNLPRSREYGVKNGIKLRLISVSKGEDVKEKQNFKEKETDEIFYFVLYFASCDLSE